MQPKRRPLVSIVAPCHNESEGLREFHRRSAAASRDAGADSYEIVLVDDGSTDDTWAVIVSLAQLDPNVRGVRLKRNFGQQAAVAAGLSLARGQHVMMIDSDLQDPPELLGAMLRLIEDGADVVYGQRTARQGETWFKRTATSMFYRVLSRLAAIDIPRDTGDFRLMRRSVVDALGAMPERQRFIRGMVTWVGGRQVPLLYERQPRFAGSTSYSFSKLMRLAIDGITSFSIVPLRLASYLGLGAAVLSLGLLAYPAIQWARGQQVVGWTSLIGAICFFSAVQLLVLGVLGEYVGRLFQEVKGRPVFLIDQVVAGHAEHGVPAEFSALPEAAREVWVDAIGETTPGPVGG